PKDSSWVAHGCGSPVVITSTSPGARPESSSRSTASSAASSAPCGEAGINWTWAVAVAGAAGPEGPGLAEGVGAAAVRCAGGADRCGPGRPGRGGAAGRGPGTGRGVGAVRPLAGVTRGPWALS